MGRLSEATSGNEAGTGSALIGPYRQQYQYDVWSNMKVRSGRLWSGFEDLYTTNYVDDRNTAWTYDEAGNAKSLEEVQNTFDVAGRLNRTISPSRRVGTQVINITIDNRFDGDGLLVKQSTNGVAKYFVRSSVLGGEEVAEVDSSGNRITGYVYANGEVIAKQQSGGVVWQHNNPTSMGERQTNSSGGGAGGAEYDPLHSSVGMFDPGPPSGGGDDGTSDDLLFPKSGDPTDLSGGCTVDWLAVPCSLAIGVLNREAGVEGPARSNRWNDNLNNGLGGYEVFKAFADGYYGYLPINALYTGGGRFKYWVPGGYADDKPDGGTFKLSVTYVEGRWEYGQVGSGIQHLQAVLDNVISLTRKVLKRSEECRELLSTDITAHPFARDTVPESQVVGAFKRMSKHRIYYTTDPLKEAVADTTSIFSSAFIRVGPLFFESSVGGWTNVIPGLTTLGHQVLVLLHEVGHANAAKAANHYNAPDNATKAQKRKQQEETETYNRKIFETCLKGTQIPGLLRPKRK